MDRVRANLFLSLWRSPGWAPLRSWLSPWLDLRWKLLDRFRHDTNERVFKLLAFHTGTRFGRGIGEWVLVRTKYRGVAYVFYKVAGSSHRHCCHGWKSW